MFCSDEPRGTRASHQKDPDSQYPSVQQTNPGSPHPLPAGRQIYGAQISRAGSQRGESPLGYSLLPAQPSPHLQPAPLSDLGGGLHHQR